MEVIRYLFYVTRGRVRAEGFGDRTRVELEKVKALPLRGSLKSKRGFKSPPTKRTGSRREITSALFTLKKVSDLQPKTKEWIKRKNPKRKHRIKPEENGQRLMWGNERSVMSFACNRRKQGVMKWAAKVLEYGESKRKKQEEVYKKSGWCWLSLLPIRSFNAIFHFFFTAVFVSPFRRTYLSGAPRQKWQAWFRRRCSGTPSTTGG